MATKLEQLQEAKARLETELAEEQAKADRLEAERAVAERRSLEEERQAQKDATLYEEVSAIVEFIKNSAGDSPLDPAALIAITYLMFTQPDVYGKVSVKGGLDAIKSYFRHVNKRE